MVVIHILYGILTLFILAGWGLMLFGIAKEWKKLGKIKGLFSFLFATFFAVIAIWSLFSSYPI